MLKGKYFSKNSFLECGAGTRPSYIWRSILHGRELLKQGLVRKIGNGATTNVWAENWIIDTVPRPPVYRADSDIDLTLKVSDLLIGNSGRWNRELLLDTFVSEDAERILSLKPQMGKEDSVEWGFTNHGLYSTRSGYKLTEDMLEFNAAGVRSLPPLEKKLWSNLWKIKAPPKLKHFLWRALSGALAVGERLRTRGIPIDPTCSACGRASESICHILFHCDKARLCWELSNVPLPQAGFSKTSVFLNMVHLLKISADHRVEEDIRKVFPWLLWQIWKARNALIFKETSTEPHRIATIAFEEADLWAKAQSSVPGTELSIKTKTWCSPPEGSLKCNVGVSWINSRRNCGVSWILRDSGGITLMHSRRSYSNIKSKQEACLYAMMWAFESMHSLRHNNIIFEAASVETRQALLYPTTVPELHHIISVINTFKLGIVVWRLDHVAPECNIAANAIACSVTSGHRYQSYIASGGPVWLHTLLGSESNSR